MNVPRSFRKKYGKSRHDNKLTGKEQRESTGVASYLTSRRTMSRLLISSNRPALEYSSFFIAS